MRVICDAVRASACVRACVRTRVICLVKPMTTGGAFTHVLEPVERERFLNEAAGSLAFVPKNEILRDQSARENILAPRPPLSFRERIPDTVKKRTCVRRKNSHSEREADSICKRVFTHGPGNVRRRRDPGRRQSRINCQRGENETTTKAMRSLKGALPGGAGLPAARMHR